MGVTGEGKGWGGPGGVGEKKGEKKDFSVECGGGVVAGVVGSSCGVFFSLRRAKMISLPGSRLCQMCKLKPASRAKKSINNGQPATRKLHHK